MIRVLKGRPPVREVNLRPARSTATWAFRRKHPTPHFQPPRGPARPEPRLSAQQARCLLVPAHTGAPIPTVGRHPRREKPVRLPHRKHTPPAELTSALQCHRWSGVFWKPMGRACPLSAFDYWAEPMADGLGGCHAWLKGGTNVVGCFCAVAPAGPAGETGHGAGSSRDSAPSSPR